MSKSFFLSELPLRRSPVLFGDVWWCSQHLWQPHRFIFCIL